MANHKVAEAAYHWWQHNQVTLTHLDEFLKRASRKAKGKNYDAIYNGYMIHLGYTALGTKTVVDQLRNKFNATKTLFGQIRADEVATGNLTRVVKYPSSWSILVEFFADKKGLRNQDFGQSETPLPPFSAAGSDDDAAANDWGDDAANDGDIAVGEIHDDSSSDEADATAVETEKDRHNNEDRARA
ncbi:hypothetical protein PI125_g10553 [Phytophthora idaei]|nr:hypothetical protein PI125_g10553 [Phytophthora idaei]KAG3146143.1 hypothetical protein PI126_g13443 [Phytophthora idaei]